MRSKFTAAGLALALLVSVAAVGAARASAQAKVSMSDFNGVWVLDAAKSEGVQPGMEETMTVKQDGSSFTIESKIKNQRGERTMNNAFTADGKEGEFTMRMMQNETKGKRTAKWSADGKTLEVAEGMSFQTPDGTNVDAKTTRKWSLAADGKTLFIEENRTGGMRAGQSKRVYAKQ